MPTINPSGRSRLIGKASLQLISAAYGLWMTFQTLIASLSAWIQTIDDIVRATPPVEMAAALIAPMLGLLIGLRLNRYIDNWESRRLHVKLIDFAAPLISPALAILFTAIAMSIYVHSGHEPLVLLFVFKITVAWLAVHVVMTLSSGKTAGAFIAIVILPITLMHMFGVWDEVVAFLNEVNFTIGTLKFNLYLIIKAAITLVILLWAVSFILDTTDRRLRRVRSMRASNRALIMKFLQIGLYIVVFLFALNLVGVSLTTLSIFSGALGVGIGLGLQKIASNFISGIILLFEKSIEVGNLVVLDDGTRGFVRRTSARYTLIEKSDGSEALVPNETFINQQVVNLTLSGTRGRGQIFIGVGYDSDLEQVIQLLTDAAKSHPRCAKDPAPAAFVVGFADSAISMQLDFWVSDVENGILGISSDISIAIIKSFRQHDVIIPYPHQVAVLPAEVGEHALTGNRPGHVKHGAKDQGSKAEAKQIATAAPISKVKK